MVLPQDGLGDRTLEQWTAYEAHVESLLLCADMQRLLTLPGVVRILVGLEVTTTRRVVLRPYRMAFWVRTQTRERPVGLPERIQIGTENFAVHILCAHLVIQ